VYDYDQISGVLTERRDTTAGSFTNSLLQGCDSLQFTLLDRTMTNTTDITQGKILSVSWTCSRTVLGKKFTTEDMQQAQIVIRNQP
jgi:hypothetical protein